MDRLAELPDPDRIAQHVVHPAMLVVSAAQRTVQLIARAVKWRWWRLRVSQSFVPIPGLQGFTSVGHSSPNVTENSEMPAV